MSPHNHMNPPFRRPLAALDVDTADICLFKPAKPAADIVLSVAAGTDTAPTGPPAAMPLPPPSLSALLAEDSPTSDPIPLSPDNAADDSSDADTLQYYPPLKRGDTMDLIEVAGLRDGLFGQDYLGKNNACIRRGELYQVRALSLCLSATLCRCLSSVSLSVISVVVCRRCGRCYPLLRRLRLRLMML